MFQSSPKPTAPGSARSVGRSRFPHERALQWLLAPMGVLAASCGLLLIATDGLGMSRSDLDHAPFDSFLIPGLLLTIAVGGSQIVAALMQRRNMRSWPLASLGAGAILLGWIVIEAVIVRSGRGLQLFIFSWAIAEIVIALRVMRMRTDVPQRERGIRDDRS
jgi:hypothetical protein